MYHNIFVVKELEWFAISTRDITNVEGFEKKSELCGVRGLDHQEVVDTVSGSCGNSDLPRYP